MSKGMYEKRINVKGWYKTIGDEGLPEQKVCNSYIFEDVVDTYVRSEKGMKLSNPSFSDCLEYNEWSSVCYNKDSSRRKDVKKNPDYIVHVVNGARACQHGNTTFCFYAWKDSPYVYMRRHDIGSCPYSEYMSDMKKKYEFVVTLSVPMSFESCTKFTKAEVQKAVEKATKGYLGDSLYDYLGDYLDLDDGDEDSIYDTLDTGKETVEVSIIGGK